MANLIKIGELAEKTGISIRTLHYYDEIGLLSPSQRTEVGHRLYSDRDIAQLQQILSLRQLGFSLEEIRGCLDNPDFALPKVIDLHRSRLREQMTLSQILMERLNTIAMELQVSQSAAVENLMHAMETMTMTEQYFTPEQQTVLAARFQSTQADWQAMLGLAKDAMNEETQLTSIKAHALARYWQQIMKAMIGGDTGLYESLTKLYQQEGAEAASGGMLDAPTFDYILSAIAFASLSENLSWHPQDQDYTAQGVQVLRLAEEAARRLELEVLGTEAILLGLLAENDNLAAKVLKKAGVTFEKAMTQIKQVLDSPPLAAEMPADMDRLAIAPRAKRVMELAKSQAMLADDPRIAPVHLLLAILMENRETPEQYVGVAARVLQQGFEIDLLQLESTLKAMVGASAPECG